MQPYFFPYLAYFQLIAQCDTFVFYDDVQYIKRGWVNRNRILRQGQSRWLTLPVRKAPLRFAINQRYYQLDRASIGGVLRRIEAAYHKAPGFVAGVSLIEQLMNFGDANVAAFNVNLIQGVAAHIGLQPRFILSSAMEKDPRLTGQDRVIDICRRLGATHYVNPIGGIGFYDAERFAGADLKLSFLQSESPRYPQFGQTMIPDLSIIDVLMFNDEPAIARLLREYRLVSSDS